MSSEKLTREKALIFRIVHKGNIEAALVDGCLCRTAAEKKGGYREIGNLELIEKRRGREVPCKPGGTLSDYVPFYFTPYSPMLYNIKTGYNGFPRKPMSDIIILVSSLPILVKQEVKFVFTDRHAYLKSALFSSDLKNLDRIIWPTLRARDFTKSDVDRFEKYQAEALVYQQVPIEALICMICFDESTRSEVQKMADLHGKKIKIVASSGWYL